MKICMTNCREVKNILLSWECDQVFDGKKAVDERVFFWNEINVHREYLIQNNQFSDDKVTSYVNNDIIIILYRVFHSYWLLLTEERKQ